MFKVPGLSNAVIDCIPVGTKFNYLCQYISRIHGADIYYDSLTEFSSSMPESWRVIFFTSLFESSFAGGGFSKFFTKEDEIDPRDLVSCYKTLQIPEVGAVIARASELWQKLNPKQVKQFPKSSSPTIVELANQKAMKPFDQQILNKEIVDRIEQAKVAYFEKHRAELFDVDKKPWDTYYQNFDFESAWNKINVGLSGFESTERPLTDVSCEYVAITARKLADDYIAEGNKAAAELAFHRLFTLFVFEYFSGSKYMLNAAKEYASLLESMERFEEANIVKADSLVLENEYPYIDDFTGDEVSQFESALSLCPQDVSIERLKSIYMFLGSAQIENGQVEDGMKNLDKALSLREEPKVLGIQAYYYRTLGEFNNAVANLTKSIEIDQSNPGAFRDRAHALIQLKNFELAGKDFEKVQELAPDFIDPWEPFDLYFQAVYLAGAKAELEKNKEAFPLEIKTFLRSSLLLQAEQDFEAAKSELEEALKLEPKNIEVMSALANIYLDLGMESDCMNLHDKVISMKPKDTDLQANKALAVEQLGSYEEAFDIVNNIIVSVLKRKKIKNELKIPPELHEHMIIPYMVRSRCNLCLAKFEEAENDALVLIELYKPLVCIQSKIILANVAIYKRNYQTALDYTESCLADPDFGNWAYATQAEAYYMMEEFKSSIKSADSALEIDPDYGYCYFVRALAQKKLGKKKLANQDFRKAKELDYKPHPKDTLFEYYEEFNKK